MRELFQMRVVILGHPFDSKNQKTIIQTSHWKIHLNECGADQMTPRENIENKSATTGQTRFSSDPLAFEDLVTFDPLPELHLPPLLAPPPLPLLPTLALLPPVPPRPQATHSQGPLVQPPQMMQPDLMTDRTTRGAAQ